MHLNFADRVAAKSTATDSSSAATAPSTSKTSSLARAFTTSVRKDKDSSAMTRTATQRAPIRPSQISLPIALISTTNMLSYDAPDLPSAPLAKMQKAARPPQPQALDTTQKAMSVTSSPSDISSTHSRHSNASTAATSLSVEGFGVDSPDQNHLTCYFKSSTGSAASQSVHSASRTDSVISQQSSVVSSPLIPSRATSHSKQAHVLSHKRSVSRVGLSPQKSTTSRHDSATARDSTDARPSSSHASQKATSAAHPFGKELEQLNEIAEEFSSTVRNAEQDADYSVLKSQGLGSFCAAEYLQEIAPLYVRAFGEDLNASAPTWI